MSLPGEQALGDFARAHGFHDKGPLCVALVVTRHAMKAGLPLNPDALLAESGAQVRGLGKASVQAILGEHGLTKTLAQEGGRTSRGSVKNMRDYVALLNELQARHPPLDLPAVERFWVEQVRRYFAGKPFVLRLDASRGVRAVIRDLLDQAAARQKQARGTQHLGTVMQHVVAAKLVLLLGQEVVDVRGSSVSDQQDGLAGDFTVNGAAIHVTTAPSESLLDKCIANLEAGLKPVIITEGRRVAAAEVLAEQKDVAQRVDVLDFEQFIATNVHEACGFAFARRGVEFGKLIEAYNDIVRRHETDPSLAIQIATGK